MSNKTAKATIRMVPVTEAKLAVLTADYGTKTTVITMAIDRLYKEKQAETVRLTIEWLDNLERDIGLKRLLDNMPNNFGGRVELKELI